MSSQKTPNLGLNYWAGSDKFSRSEMNENFERLDSLKAEDIALQSTQFPTETTVKGALENLKQSGDSGKSLLVIAVSDKGGTVPGTNPRTFAEIEQGIRSIPSGASTGDATAVAADILTGKTAYVASGKVTGNMANRGAGGTVTPGTTDQTKAAGYYSSAITIKGEVNLVPANILGGKTIFGVAGGIPDRGAGGTVMPGTADQTKAAGYYSSAITIKGDPDLLPANILNGVDIFGVVGTAAKVVKTSFSVPRVDSAGVPKTQYVNIPLDFTPKFCALYHSKFQTSDGTVGSQQILVRSSSDYLNGKGLTTAKIFLTYATTVEIQPFTANTLDIKFSTNDYTLIDPADLMYALIIG